MEGDLHSAPIAVRRADYGESGSRRLLHITLADGVFTRSDFFHLLLQFFWRLRGDSLQDSNASLVNHLQIRARKSTLVDLRHLAHVSASVPRGTGIQDRFSAVDRLIDRIGLLCGAVDTLWRFITWLPVCQIDTLHSILV